MFCILQLFRNNEEEVVVEEEEEDMVDIEEDHGVVMEDIEEEDMDMVGVVMDIHININQIIIN